MSQIKVLGISLMQGIKQDLLIIKDNNLEEDNEKNRSDSEQSIQKIMNQVLITSKITLNEEEQSQNQNSQKDQGQKSKQEANFDDCSDYLSQIFNLPPKCTIIQETKNQVGKSLQSYSNQTPADRQQYKFYDEFQEIKRNQRNYRKQLMNKKQATNGNKQDDDQEDSNIFKQLALHIENLKAYHMVLQDFILVKLSNYLAQSLRQMLRDYLDSQWKKTLTRIDNQIQKLANEKFQDLINSSKQSNEEMKKNLHQQNNQLKRQLRICQIALILLFILVLGVTCFAPDCIRRKEIVEGKRKQKKKKKKKQTKEIESN